MGSPIALLLSGEPADLSASICAVQLAARSHSKLYALQDCLCTSGHGEYAGARSAESFEGRTADAFGFVVEFAGGEGVYVSCHLLDKQTIDQLNEFLTVHAVTCLVVNNNYEEQKQRAAQIVELQKQLNADPRWFNSHLQVITAPILDDNELQQVIRQFRRLDGFATKKID